MDAEKEKDLRNALEYIDPSRCDYQTWTNVGMALKAAGADPDMWEEWSSRDPGRYHSGECFRKWNTFESSGISEKTIFKMAADEGYRSYTGSGDGPVYALGFEDEIGGELIVDKSWIEREEFREPQLEKWNQVEDAKRYLKAVFHENENVGYLIDARYDEKDEKWKPNAKGNYGRTAGQLIHELETHSDICDVFGDYNKGAGVWVRFNPLDGQGVKNSNVTAFRYALVESDSMDLSMQLAIIRKLELPVAAVVYSGGKSVHAIVHIDANDIEEYKKRVDYLYSICKKNGLEVDQQNKNPSRLSRMPGFIRGTHKQFLIDTNIGKSTFMEWEEWIDSVSDDLPDPETMSDIWEDLPPLAPELISGVLRQGHKMLISGPSKAGKSFSLIELCISIAEGREWFGHKCAQGKVMYINLELDRASCLHRFADVYEALGIRKPNLKNVVIWNLRGKTCPMDKLAPKLIRRCQKDDYTAVIIDPIYKVITGDENSAEQMSKFCNQFDKVATEMSCAVIYCHHHSKGAQGNKKSMDRASGSGVFARDPDAMIDMIELVVNDEIKEKHTEKAVADAYVRAFAKHDPEYLEQISLKDRSDPKAMGEHAWKKLRRWMHDNDIDQIRETAMKEAEHHTAWRIDYTLREFPTPGHTDMWFEYPIHVEDDGPLGDASPEEEIPPWKKGGDASKAKSERKKDSMEIIYSNLMMAGNQRITLKMLSDQLGRSIRTVQRYIADSEGRYTLSRIEGTNEYEVILNE